MITITMTETRTGSPNGINVNKYSLGKTYNLPDGLAKVFLDNKWANLYVEEVEQEVESPMSKAIEKPPENKAVETVPSNKDEKVKSSIFEKPKSRRLRKK